MNVHKNGMFDERCRYVGNSDQHAVRRPQPWRESSRSRCLGSRIVPRNDVVRRLTYRISSQGGLALQQMTAVTRPISDVCSAAQVRQKGDIGTVCKKDESLRLWRCKRPSLTVGYRPPQFMGGLRAAVPRRGAGALLCRGNSLHAGP